jgi:hypothetical protein
MVVNHQLIHRTVRTQDFQDFWVLGGLRANRTLLPVVPTGVALRHGALDLAIETASIQGARLGCTGRQDFIVSVAG